jgi:glutaminyl-tRNA synthetase
MGPDVLEACVRDTLNTSSVRVMAVLDPVRVVLVDYPEDKVT